MIEKVAKAKTDSSLHHKENGIEEVLSTNKQQVDGETPDNSMPVEDTKLAEVENPGKRKRRTLSDHSSSNSKKPKATVVADNTQTKISPMRSRGKSIDSKLMLEYMNAVAKNETSFKILPNAHAPSKSKPNSDNEEVQPDKTKEQPKNPKDEERSETKTKCSTLQVVTTPKSPTSLAIIAPQSTGLDAVKLTNVCSLLKSVPVEDKPKSENIIASKPTEEKNIIVSKPNEQKNITSKPTEEKNIVSSKPTEQNNKAFKSIEEKNVADLLKYKGLKIQRLGPGEPLPADKKIFSVVSKPTQTLNKTMEKLDSLKRSNTLSVNQGKPGSGTIIVNNGKSNTSTITINHNKVSSNAVVSVNPGKSKTDSFGANLNISDPVTVNPQFKTINIPPPVNGVATTTTNSVATQLNISENAKSNIEDADSSSDDMFGNLVIKEEPMDMDEAETEQAKSDKTNLFNSLQLKPNDIIAPKFTNTPAASNSKSPPKVVATGVVKKYRSAAEIRDESLAKLAEKSPLLQLSAEDKSKITNVLKVVNKQTRKIAPKPPGICQIKSVAGGRITLSAKSPNKKPTVTTVNGGLNYNNVSSSSAELRPNQMISIPMMVEHRTDPAMAIPSPQSNVSVSNAVGTNSNILHVLQHGKFITNLHSLKVLVN